MEPHGLIHPGQHFPVLGSGRILTSSVVPREALLVLCSLTNSFNTGSRRAASCEYRRQERDN